MLFKRIMLNNSIFVYLWVASENQKVSLVLGFIIITIIMDTIPNIIQPLIIQVANSIEQLLESSILHTWKTNSKQITITSIISNELPLLLETIDSTQLQLPESTSLIRIKSVLLNLSLKLFLESTPKEMEIARIISSNLLFLKSDLKEGKNLFLITIIAAGLMWQKWMV